MLINDTTCDFCGIRFAMSERHVVVTPRPSDPTDLVAVMYGCGTCQESVTLPTARSVSETVLETGHWQGQPYTFVTL